MLINSSFSFSRNNTTSFKSKIEPNIYLKNIINQAINDVRECNDSSYGRNLVVAINTIKNDKKNDTVEFSLKSKTGEKYHKPAATDVFVNGQKVMDNYIDPYLGTEEDALDTDFGKKAIIAFAEQNTGRIISEYDLTNKELEIIKPLVQKIQSLNPSNKRITEQITDLSDKINDKLCKNMIKELKSIKQEIFNAELGSQNTK